MRLLMLLPFLVLSGCKLNISYLGQGDVHIVGNYKQVDCVVGDFCAEVGFNQRLTLTAEPKPGFRFVQWSGECQGSGECEVLSSRHKHVRAQFEPVDQQPMTIEFNPGNSFFFAAPWPNDARLTQDGTLNIDHFPFERNGEWADQFQPLAKKTPGFSTNGAIYFQTSHAVSSIKNLVTENALLFALDADGLDFIPLALNTLITDQPERSRLIAFTPRKPLRSNTRYGMVLLDSLNQDLGSSDPLEKSAFLEKVSQSNADLSEAEMPYRMQYQELLEKLTQAGARTDNVVAFTVFTTQNTLRFEELIGKTRSQWNKEFILSRVEAVNHYACSRVDSRLEETFYIDINMPYYLTGEAPYINGGGALAELNGVLEVQSDERMTIEVHSPCSVPANEPIEELGVEVIAAQTVGNYYHHYRNRGHITVGIDAPYSAPHREPTLPVWLNKILELAGFDPVYAYAMFSHFNPFNVESNIGLHYQYAIDLLFVREAMNHMPDIVGQPLLLPVSSSKTIYSGTSFGSIAAFHAGAIDSETDALRLHYMSRVSHSSLNHILSHSDDLPTEVFDAVALYVGVKLPVDPVDPSLHLLQTVLEPIDTVNLVESVSHLPIWTSMGHYSDPFHGGPSSYDLLKAMDASVPFNLNYKFDYAPSGGTVELIEEVLGRNYEVVDSLNVQISGDLPYRFVMADWYHDESNCFSYEVFNWEYLTNEYGGFSNCFHSSWN